MYARCHKIGARGGGEAEKQRKLRFFFFFNFKEPWVETRREKKNNERVHEDEFSTAVGPQ